MQTLTDHQQADLRRREKKLAKLRPILERCDNPEPGDSDEAAELRHDLGLSAEWQTNTESLIRQHAQCEAAYMTPEEREAARADHQQRKTDARAQNLDAVLKLIPEVIAAMASCGDVESLKDVLLAALKQVSPGRYDPHVYALQEKVMAIGTDYVAACAADGQTDNDVRLRKLEGEIKAAFTLPSDSAPAPAPVHTFGGHSVVRHG